MREKKCLRAEDRLALLAGVNRAMSGGDGYRKLAARLAKQAELHG